MGLNSYSGGFLAHRLILQHVKHKYGLKPAHCDILILVGLLSTGSARVNSNLLKAYSTGKTSYGVVEFIAQLLEGGYMYNSLQGIRKRSDYRLTDSGVEVVKYINQSLVDRIKYINDKFKIAEGINGNRWKEQTKRKTAAARLRRQQAREAKLLNGDTPPPPAE